MPWYVYHGLEKYACFSTDYNTDYRLWILPFQTWLETLSPWDSSSLTSLTQLQLKKPNAQSWWVWHLLAISCCAYATMTHFFKTCWDVKHFPTSVWTLKNQQETLPCLSELALETAVKTGLLILVYCLRASKILPCFRQVSSPCLSCGSLTGLLQNCLSFRHLRSQWFCPGEPLFAWPSFLLPLDSIYTCTGKFHPRKSTETGLKALLQTFIHHIRELGWIKVSLLEAEKQVNPYVNSCPKQKILATSRRANK